MSITAAQSLEGSVTPRGNTAGEVFVGNLVGPPGPPGAPGPQGPQGPQGDTYTLTDTDKLVIADIVLNSGLLGKTPVFDLAAMGLSVVPLTGGSAALETDTTEITAALDKGTTAFIISFSMGETILNATFVMNGASANGMYQCISVVDYAGPSAVTLVVSDGVIMVTCTPMSDFVGIRTPTAIDLSGFESEGQIVETFEDGSTATTVMEFDDNGNPTKITDGNGNVTVLTW